jgi:hypothetical protein
MTLALIKTLHTAIFLIQSAAILYIVYSGITGRRDVWLVVAIVLVLAETIVFLANGSRCPLTGVARRLGDVHGNDYIADIFLPAWFAPLIPRICGGLALIGLLLVIWRLISG